MPKTLLIIFILLALTLAGCDLPFLQGEITPADTATPTPPPLPTVTQTASPTPTATPSPTPIPAVRVEQGEQALFEGDYERARVEFEIARQVPEDADIQAAAYVGLGRTEVLLGNYDQAISYLNRVLDSYPSEHHQSLAAYFLAQAWLGKNNPAQAAQAYALYLQLRPGTLDAYINEQMGNALLAAGDPNAAIQAYQASLQAPRLDDPINLQIKIGEAYTAAGDFASAIQQYTRVYETTTSDYTRATMNYRIAQLYLQLGNTEEAFARYQDSVVNFPKSYDSYLALKELVNAGYAVDDLYRGIVDYYGYQYGLCIAAMTRYIEQNPNHDGTPHYYIAWALYQQGDFEGAVKEWDALIRDHPYDRYWATAYDEKAYLLWYHLNQPQQAADTLLEFVAEAPGLAQAPQFLYDAARILERNKQLADAAILWLRLIDEYPAYERSQRALLLAGVQYYRLGEYKTAQTTFERALILASTPADQAAAEMWVGKAKLAQGDSAGAQNAWQSAALRDPTGYYSERAKELLAGEPPLQAKPDFNAEVDLQAEQSIAEDWFRRTFDFPQNLDLRDPGSLAADPRFVRAAAFWELGLYENARAEYESLRLENAQNALNSYRLLNHFLEIGLYRSAILTARQVLTLAGLDDAATYSAPPFFNHVRFGLYYKDLVLYSANLEGLHPLYLFSVIRQESFFEGFIKSGAGARGLMQIMPATGAEIAKTLDYPPFYTDQDLYRPIVSIRFGTRYLARWYRYFNDDPMAALAAYNAGPGNADVWKALAPDDPDLYLEVVRFEETRKYIMQISDFLHIYRMIYEIP